MEVKPGYKLTELGVIPEDWRVSAIESLVDEVSMGPFGSDITVSNFVSSGVPVLNGSNVAQERLYDSFENFVTPEKARTLKKAVARRGDVVVTHRGTIGQISYIPEDSMFEKYVVSQSQFRVRFSRKILPSWVVSYFHSESGSKKLLEGKGHTGVPAIAQPTRTFRTLLLPVPPLPEQREIATALSDMDALLDGLDRLIAKRRAIKQATMQQLLSGQTRLPGFSGEWEVRSLLEIAGYQKTLFDDGDWVEAEHITGEGIRLVQTGNIGVGKFLEKGDKKYIYESSFEKLKCKELKVGDILICRLAEPAGRACILPDIGEGRIITSVDVTIFRPLPGTADRNFLIQVFSTDEWFRMVLDQVGGTTHKRISRGSLGKLKVPFPCIKEQQAIATILTDMDAEITALETRRIKVRALKQGMMQELLTGRTRLV